MPPLTKIKIKLGVYEELTNTFCSQDLTDEQAARLKKWQEERNGGKYVENRIMT